MNGVFIDSSVFLDFLEGKEKAKILLEKYSCLEGCINDIVFSEVVFVYIKAETGKKSYELKKKPELIKSVELNDLVELLGRYRTLDVGEAVKSEAEHHEIRLTSKRRSNRSYLQTSRNQ